MARGRVIRGFQERRELETALQRLAQLQDDQEREALAQELAAKKEAVVPVLLRHLGSANPLLRAAIGLVAQHLPREVIAPALRRVAADPQRTDQERMAALTVLERFLNEPVEESLYAGLRDPEAVLRQSLEEVCAYEDQVPDIVLDYVAQLQDEPADVALAVLDWVPAYPAERVIPLLRLLAQDVRVPVAQRSLRVLGQLPSSEARVILEALAPVLPSPLEQEAERAARKLQMRSVELPERPRAIWRVLATPPDVHGTQAFWLLRRLREEQTWSLLGVLGNVDLGVQFAFVLDQVPSDFVVVESGQPVLLPLGGRDEGLGLAWFMDVSIAYARRWLRHLTRQNFRTSYQPPVVYRHHGIDFWWETAPAGFAPRPILPSPQPDRVWDTLDLMRHPVLDSWYVDPPRTRLDEQRWQRAGFSTEAVQEALQRIDPAAFPDNLWPTVATRLEYLAEWFVAVGDSHHAQLAMTASAALREIPYPQNPFAQALVARGLLIVFDELQREKAHWDD